MFVRVKRVKKKDGKSYEYGYLVSSKWRKRAKKRGMAKWPEHKYLGTIGRLYRYTPQYKLSFEEFLGMGFDEYIEKNESSEIFKKFVEYELLNCGFEKKDGNYCNNNVIVDLGRLMVHSDGKEAVVKVGTKRGYICSKYLEELFKFEKINGRAEGIELLKRLQQIGAKIDGEKFFMLAQKMLGQE